MKRPPSPFVKSVALLNYKSVAACKVKLEPLTFLVGPNGSGKSNFLDAFQFVSDALTSSLDHALRERGTVAEVRRRSGGRPNHFAIRIDFDLSGGSGHYAFLIGAEKSGGFSVKREECKVRGRAGIALFDSATFHREEQRFTYSKGVDTTRFALFRDRLALPAMAGTEEFRPVFSSLTRINVYNLNPAAMNQPQRPDPGDLLLPDGRNIASVLRNLKQPARSEVNRFLAQIVPELSKAQHRSLGNFETVEFFQRANGQPSGWHFFASSMSDGTLRSLGILAAIFLRGPKSPLLIGLEEPESAIHPAALRILLKALDEASSGTQIVATSHSPELLDNPDLKDIQVLGVQSSGGISHITHLDEPGRKALQRGLLTPGELLRQNQVRPDPQELDRESEVRGGLFSVTKQ